MQLGLKMEASSRHSLLELLQEYLDFFAFGTEEMPGIDPVIQKQRYIGPERAAAATTKLQKLLEAGFVRECQYPE